MREGMRAEDQLERAVDLETDERMADAYRGAARNLRELRTLYGRPQLSLEEYMALEGPKWQGVDAVEYVRGLRGDLPAGPAQRMAALVAAALATGKRVTIEITQPKDPAEEAPFVAYVDGVGKDFRHVRNGNDFEEVLDAALAAYSYRTAFTKAPQ